jgi:hypothetical protein
MAPAAAIGPLTALPSQDYPGAVNAVLISPRDEVIAGCTTGHVRYHSLTSGNFIAAMKAPDEVAAATRRCARRRPPPPPPVIEARCRCGT